MKRTLLISALVFALFYIPCQAQNNKWFIRGQGGVTANLDNFHNVEGATQVSFLKKAYKNIYLSGSFMNEASNWEDYSGKILWFTSNPDPSKVNLYLLTSGGYTHSATNEIDNGSMGIGFGSVFTVMGFNPILEVSFYQIDKDWITFASAGLQVGLEF